MTELESAIRAWQQGWAACKGLRPAHEIDCGLEVFVGHPGREREVFALDPGRTTVARLATYAASADVPTWLTVMTEDAERTSEILTAAGLLVPGPYETFMTTELSDVPALRPPNGYTAEIERVGSVLRAVVRTTAGDEAASGLMAVHGERAVAHDILTVSAHRRRGLGSIVMASLSSTAHNRGARTAYLIASPDGERLYTALGWSRLSSVVSGHPS